ncbi:MAG: hypothetical protein A3C81_02230 [Candidatus Yanofskybacteria bacterium RIFCSPHIGHO2_02_FULL_46_19]|uniref:Uncharacterized protein n=2 Tax=Candidatus Yanofskyibacteriota TaxID=1752733 RepID=A0A1F8H313_9BACT|nr:MAG: hypothetical protein A3C81_02230 [Candidatus Yanofskybacteria bacterium RIFCSPHIGHO2_02_FULL_46_19]OGN25930.1 MAG: hypothetical protein A3B17_01280 [Candidatus Yanofskybacteria bacterium RIFCSPLOWO2_01_FULL_45_72]OGN32007.1 MAG: hypothetical protein A3J01_02970 [Candidatus Yanofskybacteria bacterium RIFCSPLOWO2_02_FULL_45_18]
MSFSKILSSSFVLEFSFFSFLEARYSEAINLSFLISSAKYGMPLVISWPRLVVNSLLFNLCVINYW